MSVCNKKGSKVMELKGHSWGVAGDKEGCIYVSEYLAYRVTKFDSNEKFLKAARKQGSGDLEFYYPRGICLVQNKLYVCDGKNNRIQVLDKELQYLEMLIHSPIKSQWPPHQMDTCLCSYIMHTPNLHESTLTII